MVDRKICPVCGFPDSYTEYCPICGYDNTMIPKWQYTLTISVNNANQGSVVGASNGDKFGYGELVELKAVPNSGCVFDYWTINGQVVIINPVPLAIIKDYTIIATFKAI